MAESTIFILIIGIVVAVLFQVFEITWIDPRLVITILFLLIVPGLYAAFTSGPFVPSTKKRHKNMLKLANLDKKDVMFDLGCGDGRLVFSAARHCKKAIGYELSIPLIIFGKIRALFHPNASIKMGNIWKQDYHEATVIFCYLLPRAMKQFFKEVWPTLKPGTRVISNAFMMHELEPFEKEGKVYLYVKE